MYAYRFRVFSEDIDDFHMDVELLSVQTFLDFHLALKQYLNITSNELASFYLCDDKWRKVQEITLIDMHADEQDSSRDNAHDKKPILLMENTRLNQAIDNPHQKMLYVYDYALLFTLQIELTQVFHANPKITYPNLAKKVGDFKFSDKANPWHSYIPHDDFDEDMTDDFGQFDPDEMNDEFFDDDMDSGFDFDSDR